MSTGTRLGPYVIEAPLGAGGMGEVYRARDTRLDRVVAIKVLPAQVSMDADRQSRFEREARAVAKLNHPNVLALFDVGSDGDVRYIVTELVEGEPVRGPLPARRLSDIAAQIADGLAAAHAAGVVHRDLKPDNILLTRDGRVKILDFGLATDRQGIAESVGATRMATSPGTVLGTVAYMSPEQARGGAADVQSDQFSLGLVLYELACGRRAFARDSDVQTLSAIIEADPDLSPLAPLPAPLRWVVERCLAKEPADRYGSTRDLARDLRQIRDRQSELGQSDVKTVAPPLRRRRWPAAVALAVPLLAIAAAVALRAGRDASVSLDAAHFVPFATEPGVQSMPAWSPDGQTLAYSGEADGYYQIFTRQLGQSTPTQLTSFDADCLYSQWDPTGTRLFFQRASKSNTAGIFGEVWVVSAAGGAPERVSEGTVAFTVAPAGEAILYLKPAGQDAEGVFELWSHDLKTGATRRLRALSDRWTLRPPSSGSLRFSPDGAHLALLSQDVSEILLFRNPLSDPAAEPTRVRFVATGGTVVLNELSWLPDSRRFVVELRDSRGGDKSIWMGDVETGTVTRVTASVQWESAPAVSPGGTRMAFSATTLNWDILEVELPGGQSRPLVASSRYDGWGEWLPDGASILYSTNRTGRFEIWAENLRDHVTRPIVTPDAFPGAPSMFIVQSAVSPDARSVAYLRYGVNEQRIYVSAIAGSRPVPLVAGSGAGREEAPAWSPDGRWIVFGQSGKLMKALASGGTTPTVLAQDFEESESQRARWLPDGRTVIYRSAEGLKQVSADGGPARLVTRETPVLWDASPDGRLLYAIIERERRAIDLATIEVATGAVRTLRPLGRRPLSPDYSGYWNTLRAMRVSPDGTRLMYAFLNPEADIWILEGFTPPSRPWWRF